MRQRPVVVIAVSLLLIAGATVFQLRGQILHQLDLVGVIPGSAPLAIGSLWNCPSGSLRAYRSSLLYYPSYHPDLPPHATKPARCYRTDGEAKSAGYRLAPPPAGGAMLDGVYLVPSSDRVRTDCEEAAAQLRIAIPCPTMMPLEAAGSLCHAISVCTDGGAFVTVITLTTPPDFPGARAVPEGLVVGHHIQLQLAGASLTSKPGQQLNQCSRGNFGPTVMERPTLWATCDVPPAEFPRAEVQTPTALIWEVDDSIYEVGGTQVPETSAIRRMVEFFASKLIAVSPTGG